MNKKLVILLVVTHLLCVLLGYCISALRPVSAEPETVTDAFAKETATLAEGLPAEEQPENVIETEDAAEPTVTTESLSPTETVPVYTQPQVSEPPVTAPSGTEPPASQPPVTDPPVVEPPSNVTPTAPPRPMAAY